ncbi:hypothetical protein M0805_008913 [Coniferiporia weirii]|nr:hypothetical protein M0805_008913 [Coniferiporia weirii]
MANVDAFVPNGLLGDFRSSADDDLHSQTAATKFLPNGLLSESEVDSQEETLVECQTAFKPNGLLDAALPMNGDAFKSNGLLDDASAEEDMFESNDFRPNGLLDDIQEDTQATFVEDRVNETSPVISQDELPSLSQILRPHAQVLGFPPTTRTNLTSSGFSNSSTSLCATTFDGKTFHLKRRPSRVPKSQIVTGGQQIAGLLEKPIYKLMDQLSETTAAKLVQAEASSSAPAIIEPTEDELWVDRYRPSCFTDLLGDERVHRETMGWLKEWDHCVFGKKKAMKRQKKLFNDRDADFENQYEDAYHRPREKILLLSGPAGYGKTTLAHVAARQAGYEVLEINASDSRSGQIIDDRIRPVLESGSAVGSKKPVCVIIDEIDGATGAGDNSSSFVHKLAALTFEKTKKKGRGKDKDTRRPLLRPLICICNDLYSSSLTKLRQYARIIRFTRPADIYFTKRLRSICESEGLRADSRALTTLVGIAKGDMRGCLNTLQFIKARNQDVTESIIRAATVGMKEGDASFTSVLSSLFAPLPKKRVKELGLSELDESRYVGRLSADVEASGSVDRVALGCFEHYTNLRHSDVSLARHEKAADWLMTFDTLSGTMRSEREYGLLPYLSYSLVAFYPLFNERGGSKVERPKADWDNLMKTRTNEEVYKSLSKCVQSAGQRSAGLRHLLSNEIMQLEFAPYINRIISPPLRPVNSQVTRPQERALLARLVDIMVSLELRFVQEKAEDGQLVYRLEPPVDAFMTYDGKRAVDIAVQRYATRQLIAGEIDAQLIARQAEATERGKAKSLDMFKKARKVDDDEPEGVVEDHIDTPTLGKRKADALDPADKPPVDFFGRPITTQAPLSKRSKGGAPVPVEKAFKVSFRFKEGNSAAVRKSVKVSSFL